jgi:hypothetical protein
MLRTCLIAGAAFTLSAFLGACATDTTQTTRADGRDCFHADQVSGYSVVDDHHVAVSVGANRNYILETNWNARDLDWGTALVLQSDMSWICAGDNLGVRITGGDPVRTYWIRSVARGPDDAAQGE